MTLQTLGILAIVLTLAVLVVLSWREKDPKPKTLRGLRGHSTDSIRRSILEAKQEDASRRLAHEKAAAIAADRERKARFWETVEGKQ